MSIFRTSIWAAAAAIVLTGARFALAAIVARRLSQTGFGQFAYTQWLIDVTFLVCSFGVAGAVTRYVAQYRNDPSRLAAIMRRWRPWSFALPIASGFAVVLGAKLSGIELLPLPQVLLALWGVAQGRWAMQTAALTGCQRFDLIFLANMLAAGIMVAGAVLLPLNADDPSMLFALMAIAASAAATIGLSVIRRLGTDSVRPLAPQQWQSIRGYAFNIWVTTLLWSLVWSRGELPVVRAFLGDEGVAHYSAVMLLLAGAIQGAMLAVSGVAPEMTRLLGEGQKKQAEVMARQVMDLQLLGCGAATLVLSCLGPEILTLVFGAAYRAEADALAILSLGLIAITFSSHNHILQITTDARFNRNTSLLGLMLLFVFALALTPAMGIDGAAIARVSAMGLLGLISYVVVRRQSGTAAVSLWNLMLVLGLSFTGLIAALIAVNNLPVRATVLIITLTLLTSLLRAQDGNAQIIFVLRKLFSRFLASRASSARG